MSLAIIIPNYNKAQYLEHCLNSIYKQTLVPDEIIVVDDCSTDTSIEILNDLQRNYKELKVVALLENKGVSNARNVGVAQSQSDFVTFLDSDDFYYNEHKLENEMNLIKINGAKTVAYSYTYKVDEQGNLIRKRMGSFRYPEGNVKHRLIANYRFCSAMPRDYCLSKELFYEAGGYTPGKNLYEDMEFTIKLCMVGAVLKNTKKPGTGYRLVQTGLSRQKKTIIKKALKDTLKNFYKKENFFSKLYISILRLVSFGFRCLEFVLRRLGVDIEKR